MYILKADIKNILLLKLKQKIIYTIDLNKTKHHEFDVLKENKDYFYNNFNYNQWTVYLDDSTDISIDELESYSKGEIKCKK